MSDVHETISVEVPFGEAEREIERLVSEEGAAAASGTMTLRAPLSALRDIGSLQHDADVSYVVTRDPHARDRTRKAIAVRWEPSGGGPFPTMWGLITLQDIGGRETAIDFSGHYQPPLGSFGAAFDAAIGGRIASATVQALLGEMRARLLALHTD